MHRRTKLSFVEEFRWVSPLHYLKNGLQNAVLLWCMLQTGPPSLHYYCAVMLHSCIVLPPVGLLQTMSIILVNLKANRAVFRIFIALLSFSFNSPSYFQSVLINTSHCDVTQKVLYSLYRSITTHLLIYY